MRFNELTEQRVREGGMPPSIIRVKEKIRLMTDAEKKEYFKGKTREQLVNMARSHGYGENSNVYAQYVSADLNEFAPGAGDEGPGDDPYKYPKPESYRRSIDFFGQFEAEHFDREDMNDATGEFKGYWGKDQIAYFKFNNPAKTGSDDPGMGWYYEPQSNGGSDDTSAEPAIDRSDERNQQELGMIDAFLKSGQKAKPGSQIYSLMKKHGIAEGRYDNRDAYQRDYDSSQTGFGPGERDSERHDIDTNNEYRAEHGTWYIRIDGMVDPTPYQGKAAANAAGLELKKQPGNENKLFMLTTKA